LSGCRREKRFRFGEVIITLKKKRGREGGREGGRERGGRSESQRGKGGERVGRGKRGKKEEVTEVCAHIMYQAAYVDVSLRVIRQSKVLEHCPSPDNSEQM